jgi:putative ABC transport system substrate-binding protein
MRRREFVLFGGVLMACPLAARAQDPGRVYRLGSLHRNQRSSPNMMALFDEVRKNGFVEGANLSVDADGWGLTEEQFPVHAADLVKARVDVIICSGDSAVRAAQKATKTISILANASDMVSSGFVRSLANPDGNTTGFSILANQLDGKRQEILMEIVPAARHIAVLSDPKTTSAQQLKMLADLARTRGVELAIYQASSPDEIGTAIEAAKHTGAEALNVLASAQLYLNRRIVMERVAALRLPAIYEWPNESEEGGLVGYGASLVSLFRDIWGRQLVKLLRGAKPTDLPIEQPTTFELVVNLKTAKALGLTIPESFLARADKVIE